MDPVVGTGSDGRWFSKNEIRMYLDQWLQELQQEFEFVWAISTLTIGTITSTSTTTNGTITSSTPPICLIGTATFTPGMLRNEAVYYNGFRLSGRLLQDLEVGDPIWRGDIGNGTSSPSDSTPTVYDIPRVAVMYKDSQSILIWPCPPPPTGTSSNVFTFEYPALLSFAGDAETSGLPVWTQWCAKPYVCMRLFQRPGPINDARKALRYKAQFERAKLRVRRLWDGFLPERFRRLVPGQQYEWNILIPPPAWGLETPTANGPDLTLNQYRLPSDAGAVVVIPTFAPFANAQIYINGILQMDQGVDYTRDGLTVTFTEEPDPTDIIVAVVT